MEIAYREFQALSKRVDDLEKQVADMKASTVQWVVGIGVAIILVVVGVVGVHTSMLIFIEG